MRRATRKTREMLAAQLVRVACHWCHVSLTVETSTLDHLIPLAAGGFNEIDNYVLSCYRCNNRREHIKDHRCVNPRNVRKNRRKRKRFRDKYLKRVAKRQAREERERQCKSK